MKYRIYSYNVNGIRSALQKGFLEWLSAEDPDIIALQEIKANPDQFDSKPILDLGYEVFCNSADKKGYSGVATFTKIKPLEVMMGMNHRLYDSEGRILITKFPEFTHINAYFPSGTSGEIRQEVKMQFLEEFFNFIEDFRKDNPKLIISGDYNIAHKEIDINNPKRHLHSSGFLPEERAWLDKFLGSGFIDSFRFFSNSPDSYSWWSYRANSRAKNLGWRIDYHMVSKSLSDKLYNAKIHKDIVHSDHCPISVELRFT